MAWAIRLAAEATTPEAMAQESERLARECECGTANWTTRGTNTRGQITTSTGRHDDRETSAAGHD